MTTSINAPNKAIRQYDNWEGWNFLVTGDRKTPPEFRLDNGVYVSWEEQQEKYPEMCRLVGPDSVARGRMLAFVEAYNRGAELICTVDDDCYPYPNFLKDIYVGKETMAWCHELDSLCFDPIMKPDRVLWHRGFPLELRDNYPYWHYVSQKPITPLIQVNLWNGDPDVDTLLRLALKPVTMLFGLDPFWSTSFSPFDSQNTIVARSAVPDYSGDIPFTGRTGDIWAGYIFEALHPNSVIYGEATQEHRQKRSLESMLSDLEQEVQGHRDTMQLIRDLIEYGPANAIANVLPLEAQESLDIYRSYLK